MPYTKPSSLSALILVNLIPLLGVIFLGWDAAMILFLYWFENIVIGIYNVQKIKKARGKSSPEEVEKLAGYKSDDTSAADMKTKKALAGFFVMHYGIFTFVHGMFIVILFGLPDIFNFSLYIALASLFVSHGISYRQNFIENGEFMNASPEHMFVQPYKRIVIIHLTILASGFLISTLGEPIIGLIILVALKLGIDIYAHNKEHKKFQNYGTHAKTNQDIPA